MLARRHLVDGSEWIVLHDQRPGGAPLRIGPREWGLLAAADGTRDLEGIVIAAARSGSNARVEMLRAFLENLAQLGCLAPEDSPPPLGQPLAAEASASAAPRRLPLVPLPGFRLHCDGRGTCCRIYGSVVFLPRDVLRARALRPDVCDGGARADAAFTPLRGSSFEAASSGSFRDGACGYLAPDQRCSLHALGGSDAKPVGCSRYPTTYCDDGTDVRVSVAVECRCVLASAGGTEGEPLLTAAQIASGDLDPSIHVKRVPEQIALRGPLRVARDAALDWSRALSDRANHTDAFALVSGQARQCARGVLDGRSSESGSITAGELLPFVGALAVRAEALTREYDTWRSARDIARRGVRWLALAARELADRPEALASALRIARFANDESFYLRASLHGHSWLTEGDPLAIELHDALTRVVVSRVLATAAGDDPEPALSHPLALVEALMRGHGLARYTRDVSLASP